MNTEWIKTLFAYNQWAHDQVWACILTLNDEQFVQASNYSIGSVRNQIVHVMSVDNRWMARVCGTPTPAHFRPEDFASAHAVRAQWEPLAKDQRAVVARLTDAELAETIAYEMPSRGGAKANTRWEILLHMINHGTDHRAQILRLLYELGAPTVEQDLMIYLWDVRS